MSLLSLLRKELHWSKRNALVLVFLLLLIPVFFTGTTLLFQETVPRSVPVAVVAENENVTGQQLTQVEQTIESFSNPRVVESERQAQRMLERESVYGIVTVPSNLTNANASVEVTFTIDGSIVPFQSPSEVIETFMSFQLDRLFDADVSTQREVVRETNSLPEYLHPTFLMTLTIFIAFTYVPYLLRRDSQVLDRIRLESSLESLVTAKLVFLTAAMSLPILVFHTAAVYNDHAVDSANPSAIAILLLTFLLLGTISTTVMILTRFDSTGIFVNLVVMLGLIGLSALGFPIGFFSSVRTTVAQMLPTHYAIIMVRSMMMKGSEPGLFLDYIGLLAGLCLLSFVVLKATIVHYKRSQ
jgi:ABC-2 type transport system permease protein